MSKKDKQASKAENKQEVMQDQDYSSQAINKYLKKEILDKPTIVEKSADKLKHCKTISDTNKIYEEYNNQYYELLELMRFLRNEILEKVKDEMVNIHEYQNTLQNDDNNNIDLEGGNLVVHKNKPTKSKKDKKQTKDTETEEDVVEENEEEYEDVELKEEVKPEIKPKAKAKVKEEVVKEKKTKKKKEEVEVDIEKSESSTKKEKKKAVKKSKE